MKELRDTIQESVSLYIPVNDQRMCVQRVNSNHSLRQFIEIGDRLPLNRGSGGKLLIAYMQLMQQDVDPGEIASILNKGYAVSIEEREQGVASVSAPVRNNKAEVIASLTISGSAFRFQSNNLQSYIYETVQTAKRISGLLGYQK